VAERHQPDGTHAGSLLLCFSLLSCLDLIFVREKGKLIGASYKFIFWKGDSIAQSVK
jgi:hypothetical protein